MLLYSEPQSTYSIARLLNNTTSSSSPAFSGLECEVSDAVQHSVTSHHSPLLSEGFSSSFPEPSQSGPHRHLPLQTVWRDFVLLVRPHTTRQQESHRPGRLQHSSNDTDSGGEVKFSIST